jgi:hypothetical protein
MEARIVPQAPANALPRQILPEPAKEFNRFKEARFRRVADVAKRLNENGYEAIVGSVCVKWRLEEMGVRSVFDPGIANENEIILNRSRTKADSNFFVFLKFDNFKSTAFFTDPANGEAGRALAKEKLMRRSISYLGKEGWAGEVTKEVLEVAQHKPLNSFYLQVHGHWGESRESGGTILRDDGVSKRKDIIRQFMLWHYDVDATGYHNWIDFPALTDIRLREKDAGIVKVPSLEFTMPFREGASNGPHLNLWFAGNNVAEEFQKRFLDGKTTLMPGMASVEEKRSALKYITKMRKNMEMALGVAHPSCIMNVVVGRLPVGLLNLLLEKDEEGRYKYSWGRIMSFVKKYVDGVGAFNPTLEDYKLDFRERNLQEYFDSIVGEIVARQIGGNASMRENCVNMAFAKHMRDTLGTFPYMDPDTHEYPVLKKYGRAVSPLAYGRTVIRFASEESFRLLREKGGLTPRDVVRIMRERKYEGKAVELGMETFLEMHKGSLKPVAPRRSAFHDFLLIGRRIYHGWINLEYTLKELWRRNKNAVSPEDAIRQLGDTIKN